MIYKVWFCFFEDVLNWTEFFKSRYYFNYTNQSANWSSLQNQMLVNDRSDWNTRSGLQYTQFQNFALLACASTRMEWNSYVDILLPLKYTPCWRALIHGWVHFLHWFVTKWMKSKFGTLNMATRICNTVINFMYFWLWSDVKTCWKYTSNTLIMPTFDMNVSFNCCFKT
jgi:hypothetical protein